MMKDFMAGLVLSCVVCFTLKAEAATELDEAQVSGAKACFIVLVVDDEGSPVEAAHVHARLGMNFGKWVFVDAVTSKEGKVKIEGTTTGFELGFEIYKEGYYLSEYSMCLISQERDKPYDVKNGKWQPWGKNVAIVVRKIDQPVKLIRYEKNICVPETNVWMGLDLKLGDWVKPYGMGTVADLETRVIWDGKAPLDSRYCKTEVRFPEKMSGAYQVPNQSSSLMPFPKMADTNAVYESSFEYYDRKDSPRLRAALLPDYSRVIRTRCVVSDDGRLLSANYCNLRCLEATPGNEGGKAVLGLECGFNPKANDINLEDAYLTRKSQLRKTEAEKARQARSGWNGLKSIWGGR